MATPDYLKSLLGKSGKGFNVGDIIGTYLTSTGKRNNRMRNILGLTALFGLREDKMKFNAIKNLEESERNKVFDQAKVNKRWMAYDNLMKIDEEYRKNPNYFTVLGEAEFAKINPNFDLGTEDAREKRAREIKEWATFEENLHKEKIQNPAFNISDQRMSKEEFFKPFEDYYVSQQEAITAPKELSIVHKAWDLLGGKKKDELSPKEIEAKKNKALRGSFGFLLDPREVNDTAKIELFRDPNAFTLTKNEATFRVIETVKDPDLQRSIIRKLDKQSYTTNELQAAVIVGSTNFDALVEKSIVAQNRFESNWKRENPGKSIPTDKDPNYIDYVLRRTNYVEEQTGQGDKDTIALRKKIYLLEDLQNKGVDENSPVIKSLKSDIKLAGIDKVRLTLFNTIMAELADPATQAFLEKEDTPEEEYAENKMTDFLNIYGKIFD